MSDDTNTKAWKMMYRHHKNASHGSDYSFIILEEMDGWLEIIKKGSENNG
jgi:hypothetical protein